MVNVNELTPAIEKLQKQLLNLQKISQPTIVEQMASIDFEGIFAPLPDIQLKLVPPHISLALDKYIEQINPIIQPHISQLILQSDELTSKLNTILPHLEDELVELKELKVEDLSTEGIKEISNTFNQISETAKTNKLTIGDWVALISLILTIVFRIFPEGPSEEIINPLNSLVSIISDYTQQSLTNQELSLEKHETQIENQEKIIELLKMTQCDCKTPD